MLGCIPFILDYSSSLMAGVAGGPSLPLGMAQLWCHLTWVWELQV